MRNLHDIPREIVHRPVRIADATVFGDTNITYLVGNVTNGWWIDSNTTAGNHARFMWPTGTNITTTITNWDFTTNETV